MLQQNDLIPNFLLMSIKTYSPEDQALINEGFLPWEDTETIEMIRDIETHPEDWKLITDPKTLQMFVDAAHNTPISRTTISLKVPNPTLSSFRIKAAQEGIPYQTLLSSIMKKYSEGRLVERK